jgi:CelD/BcsL family acetyltransferase involved in cellulose biosynthesis
LPGQKTSPTTSIGSTVSSASIDNPGTTIHRLAPGIDPQRDALVGEWDGATLYHSSRWSEVLRRTYNFDVVILGEIGRDGHLVGLLPLMLVRSPLTGRRLVSLPSTNVGGPIGARSWDPGRLIGAAVDLARAYRAKYLELRGGARSDCTGPSGLSELDYFGTYVVNVSALQRGAADPFDKRARRGVAKAAKAGVRVELRHDSSALEQFCALNLQTRHRHGVPAQPTSFFRTMAAIFRETDQFHIVQARYAERTVASIILLTYRDTVTYAYGASDQAYLRFSPNHAVFDFAIRWAADNGFQTFDFGRTAPDNLGLVEFKRQWGTEFRRLPYYYWPAADGFVSAKEDSPKYRLFTKVWRSLPVGIAGAIGPALYRHLV